MTLHIEYLIFFYMFVCLAMGTFDFLFLLYERFREADLRRRTRTMGKRLAREVGANVGAPSQGHRDLLARELADLAGMEAFDAVMGSFRERDPELCDRYLAGIAPVFDRLARAFDGRDALRKAYFAYILGRWYHRRPASDAVAGALLAYTLSDALYQRENAIEALAAIGSARQLVDGMLNLEAVAFFHHPKLVTEAAMAFAGDPSELAGEFDRHLATFPPGLQAAAINFLRMRGPGDADALLALLEDVDADPDVRIACIRYFMRRPDARATPMLRTLALSDDPALWELGAVAATALGTSPDPADLEALVRCLSSPVWFVRFNAAKSLHDAGLALDGPELGPVMESGDRYARDMLAYRWAVEEGR